MLGYVLHMRNDQMSGSKAGGNTWKGFENNKFKIDTKGAKLLPTMTHNYYKTNKSFEQENLAHLCLEY